MPAGQASVRRRSRRVACAAIIHSRGLRKPVLAVLLLSPGVVFAAGDGFYVGASLSDVSTTYRQHSWPGPPVLPWRVAEHDETGTPFKVVAGFRPLSRVAIETQYVDLAASGTTITAGPGIVCAGSCPINRSLFDARALSVSAVVFVGKVFFARGGTARWELAYGAGVQLHVANFALRLEYEHFNFSSDAAESLSLGFIRTF
jgi:hypothetical protein